MLRAKGSIFSFTNYVGICTYVMLVRTGIELLIDTLHYVNYVHDEISTIMAWGYAIITVLFLLWSFVHFALRNQVLFLVLRRIGSI